MLHHLASLQGFCYLRDFGFSLNAALWPKRLSQSLPLCKSTSSVSSVSWRSLTFCYLHLSLMPCSCFAWPLPVLVLWHCFTFLDSLLELSLKVTLAYILGSLLWHPARTFRCYGLYLSTKVFSVPSCQALPTWHLCNLPGCKAGSLREEGSTG